MRSEGGRESEAVRILVAGHPGVGKRTWLKSVLLDGRNPLTLKGTNEPKPRSRGISLSQNLILTAARLHKSVSSLISSPRYARTSSEGSQQSTGSTSSRSKDYVTKVSLDEVYDEEDDDAATDEDERTRGDDNFSGIPQEDR